MAVAALPVHLRQAVQTGRVGRLVLFLAVLSNGLEISFLGEPLFFKSLGYTASSTEKNRGRPFMQPQTDDDEGDTLL